VRFGAETGSDLERWSDWDSRWELICSAPCEQQVSGRGAFRIVTASTTSQPFALPAKARDWMAVRVDGDGNVSMIDSPELRAQRARAGAGAAGPLMMLLLMRAR
jgi:hypothetical protein